MFQSREGPIAYNREDDYRDNRGHIAAPASPLIVPVVWRGRSHTERRHLTCEIVILSRSSGAGFSGQDRYSGPLAGARRQPPRSSRRAGRGRAYDAL
jgi:hypothetical protein